MRSPAREFCLLLGLALIVGCQNAKDPPQSEVVPSKPAVAVKTPNKLTSSPPAPGPASSKPSAPIAEFKPPFPERTDMFEAPKRDTSTTRRDDEHGQTVELKGFVNVDTPRVVLSIDGVITAIPEGGESYGVQVISIQPPTVMLQRGRNRWPATLE